MTDKMAAYLEITQPKFIAVYLSMFLSSLLIFCETSRTEISVVQGIAAVVAGIFLKSAASCINDYYDWDIDLIVHPTRPIPGGRLTRREAGCYALALVIASLLSAALVSYRYLAFIALVGLAIFLNFSILKRAKLGVPVTVITNLIVGFVVVLGWAASGAQFSALVLALFSMAFLGDVAHDASSSIADWEGDRAAGVQTYAVMWGVRESAWVALMALTLSTLIGTFLAMSLVMQPQKYAFLVGLVALFAFTVSSCLKNVRRPSRQASLDAYKAISLYTLLIYPILTLATLVA